MPHLRFGFSDTPTGNPQFVRNKLCKFLKIRSNFKTYFQANKLGKVVDTSQPRTTLFNMPTPETPYGRLLNVIEFNKLIT